jgi:peroxiredoxin
MVGQLAPEFAAENPTGAWLMLSSLKKKPVALLFFRPTAPFAREIVEEIGRLRTDPAYAPTVFLGLGRSSPEEIQRFAGGLKVPIQMLRDPGAAAEKYGVGELPTLILMDSNHIVRFRLDRFVGRQLRPRVNAVKAALRALPVEAPSETALDLTWTKDPRAPVFRARDLDGRTVDLAALRGKVVVLTFFDQECPHCKRDLPRLAPVLKEFRPRGVVAIGVASRDVGGRMRSDLREMGIDFPVIVDTERALFRQYDSTGTPDIFVIDRDGFIRFRERGDRPDRAELTRLQLRLVLGQETPAAVAASLPKGRYVGDAACAACHSREYRDWLLTPHSIAWDSLAKDDKWRDPQCVACHVTAQGRPGGFTDPEASPHMVNVQCEVCHGPGGGHTGGSRPDGAPLRGVCVTCHTGKFVLNFKLDEALAMVAHEDHPDLDRLFRYSGLQRERLEQINKRRLEKFKPGVAYVGADACRDCHRKEYDDWSRTPHAATFARLIKLNRNADDRCTLCHTTGSGRAGGYRDKDATGSMINVQCEVCHGPGADHVKARPELKKETIYGITDQCSFCVIQGVCATCHDQANDPAFKIEAALPLVSHRARPE